LIDNTVSMFVGFMKIFFSKINHKSLLFTTKEIYLPPILPPKNTGSNRIV